MQACPVLAQKKRDEQDFTMKAITLSKLQKAARDGQCRLIYFDEAGFSASPSVQRGWSPRGKPHCVTPNPHCRRSVMGALDFGANTLIHEATKQSVKRPFALSRSFRPTRRRASNRKKGLRFISRASR